MRTYQDIQLGIKNKTYSVTQEVHSLLENIDNNKDLNIYIEVYRKESLSLAKELDQRIQSGEKVGKMAGLIFSLKDVICLADHGLTAGSKMLEGFKSMFTATAIQRLLDEDAIIIGRVNCDEFAMGSGNEHSIYGPTRNGKDPETVPGGSSGASAVSVQMNTCHLAIGSDTGGSVRQPASFCGVIGLKPSYGRISRYGLIAYASSFDQMGILGKDIESIAQCLELMAGCDPMDATSSLEEVDAYANFTPSNHKRIAYFKEAVTHPSIHPENKRLFNSEIQRLQSNGIEVYPVSFPLLEFLVPTYYILTTAEASSNLSRYDGVRYGHRSERSEDIDGMYSNSRGEGFGLEVKRRIMLGTFVLSEGYFDAYYTKAQKSRRMIMESLNKIFHDCDFLMLPCSTGPAWKIGSMDKDPVSIYLSDIFTVLANLAGIPAISVPYSEPVEGDFNLGIQYMAPYMKEKSLLNFINNSLNLA